MKRFSFLWSHQIPHKKSKILGISETSIIEPITYFEAKSVAEKYIAAFLTSFHPLFPPGLAWK